MKRMKYILITIFLFNLFSCANFRELTKEESEVIVNHDVQILKPDLKIKILSLISEKLNSNNSAIQVNEDGLITGNTTMHIYTDTFGLIKTYMELSFMIKYQDNNYRCKYVVKNIYNIDSRKTYDVASGIWGRYATEIQTGINNFDQTITEYIASKSADF